MTPSDQVRKEQRLKKTDFHKTVLDYIAKNNVGCGQKHHHKNSRVWQEEIKQTNTAISYGVI